MSYADCLPIGSYLLGVGPEPSSAWDGRRVRLVKDVDNFPTCLIRAGEEGTIKGFSDEGHLMVRLDVHHPELDEWDNELEIADWSPTDGPEHHPATYVQLI